VSARVRVLHEIPGRMRLRYPRVVDPALDQEYLRAILLAVPGVAEVRPNPGAASIVIHYDGQDQTRRQCLEVLGHIPREAYLSQLTQQHEVDHTNLVAMGVFTLVSPLLPRPLCSILSQVAAVPTLLNGLETLINRGLKVEVLDAAAVGMCLLRRDYFTSNAIITLLALGRYLEQASDYKSTELLKSLLRPEADTVWVEKEGLEVEVPADEVEIGNLVICGTGEMIPVDGEVSRGEASINKSSMTGEAVPDSVGPGDKVTSGSVVEEGRIVILAQNVGSATTMARMYRFLERSLRGKSEPELQVSRLADKLVPISLGLAGAQLALFGDIRRAASVLTVDYSCVLKLAHPVVVKTCMYTAGHQGVLIKGAQALEALAEVDTFIFDKTGTLTTGALEVDQVLPMDEWSADELLALAASAEQHYSHPVGEAVVREANRRNLPLPALSQVDFVVAHGVSAFVQGERVLVGSHHFVAEDEGVDCTAVEEAAGRLRAAGKSILYVAHERHLEGMITLKDQVRPETPQVLRRLKEMGAERVVVMTGDHRDSARRLAADLDLVDRIHWELRPEDKSRVIKELQAEGHKVAFVGDGVNDAPALVTADVGVCMPAGADLARESAQVVLLNDELQGLVAARSIALKSQIILKNSFQATIGLNTAVMGLASLGMLSPLASAFLHNAGTIGILGYATSAGMAKPEVLATPDKILPDRTGKLKQ
jgi:Cu2+-exporting ATPase